MDSLIFPSGWAEEYKSRVQQELPQEVTMGPDLLHKHKAPVAPGILAQTVELGTPEPGEQS